MTASDNTFDLVPPNRPSLADVGSATKVDDAAYPPDPTTMPTAAEFNLLEKLAQAYGKVVPLAVVSVTGGGSPSIASVSSVTTAVVPGTFTVTRVGAGDIQLTWAAATFPTSANQPIASINTDGSWLAPVSFNISNGVEVKTRNSGGTLTDCNFTVEIR